MKKLKLACVYLLGAGFIFAGCNHFRDAAFYVRMMPPYLPFPLALVYLSGIAEVALGIGVLIPQWRRLAGWGLIALLVAVLPANFQMALHPEQFPEIPEIGLWLRLPFQLVFMAWVVWATNLRQKV